MSSHTLCSLILVKPVMMTVWAQGRLSVSQAATLLSVTFTSKRRLHDWVTMVAPSFISSTLATVPFENNSSSKPESHRSLCKLPFTRKMWITPSWRVVASVS